MTDAPTDSVPWSWLAQALAADLLADAPDKAGEFARDRHADLVVLQAAGCQSPVAMVEAQLRAPGDRADRRGLALLALLQGWLMRAGKR